jgi:hypothetical protein
VIQEIVGRSFSFEYVYAPKLHSKTKKKKKTETLIQPQTITILTFPSPCDCPGFTFPVLASLCGFPDTTLKGSQSMKKISYAMNRDKNDRNKFLGIGVKERE